jgi:hypothetical protein
MTSDHQNIGYVKGGRSGSSDFVAWYPISGDVRRLRRELLGGEVRPTFHVCGHVHEDYGSYATDFGTAVVNASCCNATYRPVNAPVVVVV